jgi:DNA mismatch endonuclease (patch repair protein)
MIMKKGSHHSEESGRKMSLSRLGKKQSKETVEKRRLKLLGHITSEVTREKLRQANLGTWHSELMKKLYAEGKRSRERPDLKGKKQTYEHIENARKAKMGHIVSEATREKLRQANLGKKHSEQTKKKIADANIGKHNSKRSQEAKEKMRIKRLNRVFPTKDTSIEVKLQNVLSSNGIIYQKHKNVENMCQPDIFIEPNICIFADGCYWHTCPQCFSDRNKWTNQQRYVYAKDIFQTQGLINKKYVVLRFWEHEINSDTARILQTILDTMGCKICH